MKFGVGGTPKLKQSLGENAKVLTVSPETIMTISETPYYYLNLVVLFTWDHTLCLCEVFLLSGLVH